MDGLPPSCRSVLLLGEGNFSFARSLSQKLNPDVRVVATSFEEEAAVWKRENGRENVEALRERGVTCLFGVDATKIHVSPPLEGQSFDGIIFNFPHVPGKANIAKNRDLLRRFFQSCVVKLTPVGQVLVTLCNGQGGTPADQPQREKQNSWQVVDMATYGDLILTDTVSFQAGEYQEYSATGYRNQDKGFLTDRAVTHVFERSPLILELKEAQTFTANLEGETTEFLCPPDIGTCMNRNLLYDINHPLNILRTSLVCAFQTFSSVRVLEECTFTAVVPEMTESGCAGVYRVNVHKTGHSTGAWMLRPHLLGHVDDLIDRYANDGCVLLGESYHRCSIATDTFPIMHQLLFVAPHDKNAVNVVSKILVDLSGGSSCVQVMGQTTDEIDESLKSPGNTDGEKSLKRRHSQIEEVGTRPSNSGGESNRERHRQCPVCLQGKVDSQCSVQLRSAIGNWATVGLCGAVKRKTKTYDIVLLYLDQLVMHLLNVPDIRTLWSSDFKMLDKHSRTPLEIRQDAVVDFSDIELASKSKHPPLYIRDVSFWVKGGFDELHFMSVLRQGTGFLLQRVLLKEVYRDEARGDASHCYRLEYMSRDGALSKEKLARIHQRVLELIRQEMGLVAR